MKGISHFSIGVAAASCFPQAVQAAADGNPLYLVLGGFLGLLPDTLDFKFTRFFYRHDIEVAPDPNRPDARMIAEAVAEAINRAHATGQPVRIKLDTIRLGTDMWQRYEVFFDIPGRKIRVRYGPVVDTGGTPLEGKPLPSKPPEAEAPLACPVELDYMANTTIDIFDGPIFTMKPTTRGTVIPEFIPWHRSWSHSFVIGLLFSLLAGALWGPLAAMVGFASYGAHIVADQLGYLGSNLFYPFTKERIHGLKWMHSGQSWPNFMAVWCSCLVIFWNLYRATPGLPPLNPFKLFLLGVLLPAAVIRLFHAYRKRSAATP